MIYKVQGKRNKKIFSASFGLPGPPMQVVKGLSLVFKLYQCTEGNPWISDRTYGGLVGILKDVLVADRGAKGEDLRFSRSTFYRVRRDFVSKMGKNVLNWLLQRSGKGNIAAISSMSDDQVSTMLFGTDENIIPVAALIFFVPKLPAWSKEHRSQQKGVHALSLMIRLELERMAKEEVITQQSLNHIKELIDLIQTPNKALEDPELVYEPHPEDEDQEEEIDATQGLINIECSTLVRQALLEQLIGKMISERRYKAKVHARKGVGKPARIFHQNICAIPGAPFDIQLLESKDKK